METLNWRARNYVGWGKYTLNEKNKTEMHVAD